MRDSESVKTTRAMAGNWMQAAFLASVVLASASAVFYFGMAADAAKTSRPQPAAGKALASQSLAKAISLPMFFEPNQGQTAPQVKFLARGGGYGLFLTADEAVLELQPSTVSHQPSGQTSQLAARSSQPASSSVIRMRLAGANPSPRVAGASPLPGKSSYFIGNDPAKWRHNIPQFARVEYSGVYPGVDLVYYGNQGQLEYDFRVAPGADPDQIALSFDGATAHIVAPDASGPNGSGDLILSTANGDVRFHAPGMYQPEGNMRKSVAGGFRQLAGNKIGFTVGAYDHSREVVIDPVLSYSTYLGGGGESAAYIAIGPDNNVYLAGSTTSAAFPTVTPYQSALEGAQNIFIAVINPAAQVASQQLLYATYLGGSGTDTAAGIGVASALGGTSGSSRAGYDVYVAGYTTSPNFPTSGSASGTLVPFQTAPPQPGTHGFVTRLNIDINSTTETTTSTLFYSTYLAGTNAAENASDTISGLAIDGRGNAFVTGVTTSTDGCQNNFPASCKINFEGYQTQSNAPSQFFVSEIDTLYAGLGSIIYSTYFGGGNPQTGQAIGGGIAVDSVPNIYFTGGTNFLGVQGTNGEPAFPLLDAQQTCLDQASETSNCSNTSANLDAFVAKINPASSGSASLIYSTYIGGSGNDIGNGIAVDTSDNAYVTGSTNSNDWTCTDCTGFETAFQGAYNPGTASYNSNAFIAEIGSLSGQTYPLTYFTYIGGTGPDAGNAIQVDTQQAAHVTGSTSTPNNGTFPVTTTSIQSGYGGSQDAFVALIGTTLSGQGAGDYLTYLGGSGQDQGTGIALATDGSGSTYVSGITRSSDFPISSTPYQGQLVGTQNVFMSKIGPASALNVTFPSSSPSPSPVAAGTPVTFTFYIYNYGPDNAVNVAFNANVSVNPSNGLVSSSATVSSGGGGSCPSTQGQGTYIYCTIPTLTACPPSGNCTTYASVQIIVTASATATPTVQSITVTPQAGANGGGLVSYPPQQVQVDDFQVQAYSVTPTVTAGSPATIQVFFSPSASSTIYSGTITPSQSTSPSMVTSPSPSFNPTSVTLSGSGYQTTTLTIPTVTRPVTTGSVLRRGPFYAAWLPIGGLSLLGLGIGAGRKRRRWLAGLALGLIVGAILLQPGCGGKSTANPTTGGTQPGTYTVTITGTAGTGAVHTAIAYVTVL